LGDSNIYLMQYNEKEKELKEIKAYQNKININCNNKNYYFLCYELLNGDIIFSIETNKVCHFNMRSFIIQKIVDNQKNKSLINRFN